MLRRKGQTSMNISYRGACAEIVGTASEASAEYAYRMKYLCEKACISGYAGERWRELYDSEHHWGIGDISATFKLQARRVYLANNCYECEATLTATFPDGDRFDFDMDSGKHCKENAGNFAGHVAGAVVGWQEFDINVDGSLTQKFTLKCGDVD